MSKTVWVFDDGLAPLRSDGIVLNLDEAIVVLVVEQKLVGQKLHRLPNDRFAFVHLKDVDRRLRFTPEDRASLSRVVKEQQLYFSGHDYGQHDVFRIFVVLIAVRSQVN